jgi:hypothetical protein
VNRLHALSTALLILAGTFSACTGSPQLILVVHAPGLSIDIRYDSSAGSGHSHPAALTTSQLRAALKGLQIRSRDVVGTAGLFAGDEVVPAFTDEQLVEMAPHLVAGLAKSSPFDLVTFHLVQRDQSRAPLITSGGLFVRNRHLYIILANARTSPHSLQYETTYQPDSSLNPLLPIVRYKFVAGFQPADWRIQTADAKQADEWRGTLDESKVVVLDLDRLTP